MNEKSNNQILYKNRDENSSSVVTSEDAIVIAPDEAVTEISKRLIEQNREAYLELAK